MSTLIELADVRPLVHDSVSDTVLEMYIDDVTARALFVAPCLNSPGFPHGEAMKAIVRAAIVRKARHSDGEVSTEQVVNGPFSASQTIDTRRYEGGLLTRREEAELREMCAKGTRSRQAFTVLPGYGVLR